MVKAVTTSNVRRLKRFRRRSKPIEVVLGGGGVKGFAHIGFLRAIKQLNVRVGMVTGVSIGSLIAVLHVNGFSPEAIEVIFASELERINPKKLARSMLLPVSVARVVFREEPVSLLTVMRDMVAKYNLKPQPNLRLVAFNAVTRGAVLFEGVNYDLAAALAASCSIPIVFRPIHRGAEISVGTWAAGWARAKMGQLQKNNNKKKAGAGSEGEATASGDTSYDQLLFDGGLHNPAPVEFCQGPAIIARLGFARLPSTDKLSPADQLFHTLESYSSRYLDALFPNSQDEHFSLEVGRGDVAALSFGISLKQRQALIDHGYTTTIDGLKKPIADGHIPLISSKTN